MLVWVSLSFSLDIITIVLRKLLGVMIVFYRTKKRMPPLLAATLPNSVSYRWELGHSYSCQSPEYSAVSKLTQNFQNPSHQVEIAFHRFPAQVGTHLQL